MSSSPIEIAPIEDVQGRKRFIRFPWQIYRDDPLWVPPLIRSQLHTLDPQRGSFFRYGEAALFMAQRNGRDVGRIAGWINHRANQYLNERAAGFGFFEAIDDFEVASALLDAACRWALERGMTVIRGPFYFSMDDSPGVLLEGFDTPPVLLCGHSPRYYADLLTHYGMDQYRDAYAYRGELAALEGDVGNLPAKILRVADIVRRRTGVQVRSANKARWDAEVARVMHLVNEAMGAMRNHVPMDEQEFARFVEELRPVIDCDLIMFAEIDGEAVGFSATIPDIHQALKQIDGRLFPWGWLRLWRDRRRIDVASLKLLAVLEKYRGRGIDALLYRETAKALLRKGYRWVDMSLTADDNQKINQLARNLGWEQYKVYRTYQMALDSPEDTGN